MSGNSGDAVYLRSVLDAMPSLVFVLNHDVRILDCNTAARNFMEVEGTQQVQSLFGDQLGCLNAHESGGCGRSHACSDCVVRKSVVRVAEGNPIVRTRCRMQLRKGERTEERWFHLTAVPMQEDADQRIVVILDEITELVQRRKVVPMCSACKKIHADDVEWIEVSTFLSRFANIEVSHSVCPTCRDELYGELRKKPDPGSSSQG